MGCPKLYARNFNPYLKTVSGDAEPEEKECSGLYRFGYQGQFAEDETEETGYNNFELRMYDSRIGRWFALDPYNQYWSGYVGMGNNPINGVDPDGGFFGKTRANINSWFGGEAVEGKNGNHYVQYSDGREAKNFGQSGFRGKAEISNNYSVSVDAISVDGNYDEAPVFNYGYGQSFGERFTNSSFWFDQGKQFMFGNDNPDVTSLSLADNPVSHLIPLGQIPKAMIGARTVGNASKVTLVSSAFYSSLGVSGTIGRRIWTPYKSASSWSTLLGRWTPVLMEGGYIVNEVND